jgi:hypothetical protein
LVARRRISPKDQTCAAAADVEISLWLHRRYGLGPFAMNQRRRPSAGGCVYR